MVKIVDTLEKSDIILLQEKQIACLVVKNYLPKTVRKISLNFLKKNSQKFDRYSLDQTKSVGVTRSSLSFFETLNKKELLDIYYDKKNFWLQDQYTQYLVEHNILPPFTGFISEMNRVLRTFTLKKIPKHDNKQMLSYTIRSFERGFKLPTHIDEISNDSQIVSPFVDQFSMNMFLEAPNNSGKLQIWMKRMTKGVYNQSTYDGVHLEMGSSPDLEIQPEAGDLFIFDSTLAHGVSLSDGGRSTISCFIGIDKENSGYYWS
jgi:hypothetical protein